MTAAKKKNAQNTAKIVSPFNLDPRHRRRIGKGRRSVITPAVLAVLTLRHWRKDPPIDIDALATRVHTLLRGLRIVGSDGNLVVTRRSIQNSIQVLLNSDFALENPTDWRQGPYRLTNLAKGEYFVGNAAVGRDDYKALDSLLGDSTRRSRPVSGRDIDRTDVSHLPYLREQVDSAALSLAGVVQDMDLKSGEERLTDSLFQLTRGTKESNRWALHAAGELALVRLYRRAGEADKARRWLRKLEISLSKTAGLLSDHDRIYFLRQTDIEQASCLFSEARKTEGYADRTKVLLQAAELIAGILTDDATLDRGQRVDALMLGAEIEAYRVYGKFQVLRTVDSARAADAETIDVVRTILANLTAAYLGAITIQNFEKLSKCAYCIARLYAVTALGGIALLERQNGTLARQIETAIEWAVFGIEVNEKFRIGFSDIRLECTLLFALRHVSLEYFDTFWPRLGAKLTPSVSHPDIWSWMHDVFSRKVENGVMVAAIGQVDFLRECASTALVRRHDSALDWVRRVLDCVSRNDWPNEVDRKESEKFVFGIAEQLALARGDAAAINEQLLDFLKSLQAEIQREARDRKHPDRLRLDRKLKIVLALIERIAEASARAMRSAT